MCSPDTASPSGHICLPSICRGNCQSPFKAQFLLLLSRKLQRAYQSGLESLEITLPVSLSLYIAFNHSLLQFHTYCFILSYYTGNIFRQNFCLLSAGILNYPRLLFSQCVHAVTVLITNSISVGLLPPPIVNIVVPL